MGAYIDYRDAVLRGAVHLTRPKTLREKHELGNSFLNKVLGDPVSSKPNTSLSKNEIFLSKLYQGLLEIHSSLEALEAHVIYVSRFPYSNTSIKKSQYLRHVIEAYLQEFYILKERINAYITTVGRAYKKDYRHADILKKTKPLFPLVPEIFDNLLSARGVHVHQSRYTDSDLDRLEAIELFMTLGLGEELTGLSKELHKLHYSETRRKWKKTIINNNKTVTRVFDAIFEVLNLIVFTKKGGFRYPRKK